MSNIEILKISIVEYFLMQSKALHLNYLNSYFLICIIWKCMKCENTLDKYFNILRQFTFIFNGF